MKKVPSLPCLLCALLASLSASAPLWGCAASRGTTYGAKSVVVVSFDATMSGYSGSISSAMDQWNGGCGGIAGSDYPWFATDDLGATNWGPLSIVHQPGTSPTLCTGNVRCAATWDSSARTMTVYSQFGDPNNLTNLSSLSSGAVSTLIAHELGHAIGLDHDTCSGGLMNANVIAGAGITAEECSMADSSNNVPWEGTVYEGCLTLEECRMSPIVIDLAHDGYRLAGIDDPVWFDIDADGDLDRMAWTEAGSDEAFLWQDVNRNGRVDDGSELYGTAMAANGFEALAQGDQVDHEDVLPGGDGNGRIDANDRLWAHLKLWIDANHDGRSQAGEIFAPADKGVLALSLDYRRAGRKDRHGNEFRYGAGIVIRNAQGHTVAAKVYDVFFVVEPN